ncbi:MAG: acyl carrier protein [Phenylobacterium sp.]|jgi:acyl carrier protein|uniref:acyl carrier protein n=1 Tax=Phenylobacterium sp. TaxID=1871053 RepID=UPI002A36703A|nr:acyl carrier protein [Phenylobacterium sp.]MDX9999162.1 acyl carrier protein [Phenylobacterium sp.]
MTESDIITAIREELARMAPEIAFETLDPAADLREQADLDSMDFLNLLTALHQRLGVEIPDADAQALETITGAVAYLARKAAKSPET